MNYLAKFDRLTRDCCEILTPQQQIRSGYKTRHQLRNGAMLLQREMRRPVPLERIEQALINPIRHEMPPAKDYTGLQYDPRSGGSLIIPPRQADVGVGVDMGDILFPDVASSVPSGFSFLDEFQSEGIPGSYAFETDTESNFSGMFPSDVSELSGLGYAELDELYNRGAIDISQLAQGQVLLSEGGRIPDILALGRPSRGGAPSSRGGRREGAGRPTRAEREITAITGQTAGEQRREAGEAIDEMLEEAVAEIEQEEQE
jgi:hypothetical protein